MKQKLKVLYVDDESINTTLFKINFKKIFDVVLSPSGDEALRQLEEDQDVDVVVSDFKMPGINGVEFIREANRKFGTRPSIILTGFDTNQDIEEAIETGEVAALIDKPIIKERVIETILHCHKSFEN